jgi:hypothetical protein
LKFQQIALFQLVGLDKGILPDLDQTSRVYIINSIYMDHITRMRSVQ